MGALTNSRKRGDDYFRSLASLPPPIDQSYGHIAKKAKLSVSMSRSPPENGVPASPSSVVSRISQYPATKPRFSRDSVHAPVRNFRFGVLAYAKISGMSNGCEGSPGDGIGESAIELKYDKTMGEALRSLRYVSVGKRKEKEVIEVDGEDEDSGIEEVEIVDFVGSKSKKGQVALRKSQEVNVEMVEKEARSLDSCVVSDVSNARVKVDPVEKLDSRQSDDLSDDLSLPQYKKMLNRIRKRYSSLSTISFNIDLQEKQIQRYQLLRPQKKEEETKKDLSQECFVPLTEEEDREVSNALSNVNRKKVLVTHKNSNIDITGQILQCLRPGGWLNDEVINLYLELLKEREKREPQKFLKCHFFNTFFYKKLIDGRGGYNYQSVRRWTTLRKLGYSLLECDKIFVPIHQQIHWTLAIINKKEQKIQYLDSLGGVDTHVMNVLPRYFVDEVKDKSGKVIDVSSWEQEYVEDLPAQENGFDCGVFMIKYADFYSRDIGLCFSQENMPYFRRRIAKEILRLRAD